MLLAIATARPAWTQQPVDFPTRNITYVVPFPAGGVADILARIYTPALADVLGKPIVIENRPGASTSLATNSVMRAPPESYTILQVDMSYAVTLVRTTLAIPEPIVVQAKAMLGELKTRK